jgi:DNA-binding beta-propeller fold protein YncE
MKNKTAFTLISLLASPLAFAVQPVIMTGPSPAIASTFPAGSSQTFVYTITNRVPKRLPITINGLSGTVNRTTVPNDCGNTLPAAQSRTTPSTCNIGISIAPTQGNVGSTTNQTFQVDYKGRRPLTASISFATRAVRIFVGSFTNIISQCIVNVDTGVISECRNFTDPTFVNPADITVNPARTFAYIANFNGNSISACPIQANGYLGPCTSFPSPALVGPSGITTNRTGTLLYVTNFSNSTLAICSINSTGGISQCSASAPGPLASPNDITLDPLNQFSYNTNNANNTVLRCQITANGSFGPCNLSSPPPTFFSPTGIAVNAAGTKIYINNGGDDTVYVCSILPGVPFLGGCTKSNPNGTFVLVFGKNAVYQNSLLFVANQNATVSVCMLNAQGALTTCTAQNPEGAFSGSLQGIAVF